MDTRIEAAIESATEKGCTGLPKQVGNYPVRVQMTVAIREAIQEVGKVLAQIAAEFDPKRYSEDIYEALLRAVDVQK